MMTSFAILGAAIGSIIVGPFSDRYGRKKIIIIADILFFAGSIVMATCEYFSVLIVGRVIVGVNFFIKFKIKYVLFYLLIFEVRHRICSYDSSDIFGRSITKSNKRNSCYIQHIVYHRWATDFISYMYSHCQILVD